MINVVGLKAQEKGLEFCITKSPEVPTRLVGDPLRIGQIILNLANNAIKFTETGELILGMETEERTEESILLKYSVKDTGIGLTQKQKSKLFQAFSQADSSTTRKFGGTGLGLSISKRLAEMMGGSIWVESRFRKGSTFYFTTRLGLSSNSPREKQLIPEKLRSMQVLVVDDNETSREVLTDYLTDFSFRVKEASSGEEGLRELERESEVYDLILMDWQMPGMNGIETIKRIHRLRLRKQPRIIMLTAISREEVMKEAEEIDLNGFLIKPVSQSLLFDTIMEVFGEQGCPEMEPIETVKRKSENLEEILGAKVLLVEDNEINQEVARELLEQEGFQVDMAENGVIAVEKAFSHHYNLILMDLQMPRMDGYEATKRIRERCKPEDLRIVAMTADAMCGVRNSVIDAGMDDYITKPIEPEALFEVLLKWINPKDIEDIPHDPGDTEGQSTLPVELPQIFGIDMTTGIRRVSGNRALYRKLLLSFYDKNQNFGRNVKEALEGKDRKNAERIAHTLKGVAGNIGADGVFEAAKNLDGELKKEDYDNKTIVKLLKSVEQELEKLFTEIQPFAEAEKIKHPVEENSGKTDPEAVQSLIHQLKEALEDYDSKSKELFRKLSPYFNQGDLREEIDSIGTAIDAYDYEKAMELFNERLEKLKESVKEQS